MTSLTLNKITSQRGISVGEATKKISDLGWNPTYVQEAATFPTDYKINKAPRDPMKQVLRSYFPMQEEKDNRVYGALDAALPAQLADALQDRWTRQVGDLQSQPAGRVLRLHQPLSHVSATAVRARLAAGAATGDALRCRHGIAMSEASQ